MNRYDIALKRLLHRAGGTLLRDLTGLAIERWHNVELPSVRQRNVDLLGETADGRLVHIELQSSNDGGMALRMAEYALAIVRQFDRFPEQVVLYVGQAALNMNMRIEGPHLAFDCRVVDIREIDGDRLLESPSLDDSILAILTTLRDERVAVRRVLSRIAEANSDERAVALLELMILAGLRKLGVIIRQEAKQMPITEDFAEHDLFGPELKRRVEQGRAEGRAEEGRKMLRRQSEKRFGALPRWAEVRIENMNAAEIEDMALRLLDASTLTELFE